MRAKLSELGTVITGNTPAKQESKYWESSDIPFIKPDVINQDGITELQGTNEYISEMARSKARIVEKGVVLVTCIGTIGKICLTGRECAFNQQINAIIPNDKVLPEYLAYCIYYNRPRLIELANAPVVPIINKRQFEDFSVNIEENIAQQSSIVTILKEVNRLIYYHQQQLQKLDELVKARFVEMFGSCKRMASMNELCSIITDGTHQPPKFQSNGIPFIFVSNLVKNTVTYNAEKFISEETYSELYKRTPIEVGDLLLSTVGSYGHPAVVAEDRKFLFQRHIAYLKPKHDIVNSFYLQAALLSPVGQSQIEKKVKGVAQKTLNLSEIKKILVPLPSIEEQNAFEAFVKQTDKLKNAIQKALNKTQVLFDSLMWRYFG